MRVMRMRIGRPISGVARELPSARPRASALRGGSALRRLEHLDVVDNSGSARDPRRDCARQASFVLGGYGTPQQNLASAHQYSNLGGIDLPMMHLCFDATAQLRINWGN